MGRQKVTIYLKNRKKDLENLLSKSKSLAKALLTGEDVSLEIMEKRLEICQECPHVDKSDTKGLRCSICGCKVRVSDRALINLARYSETKDYGCPDPKGSRWQKGGV